MAENRKANSQRLRQSRKSELNIGELAAAQEMSSQKLKRQLRNHLSSKLHRKILNGAELPLPSASRHSA
jgi:hypothetical protein